MRCCTRDLTMILRRRLQARCPGLVSWHLLRAASRPPTRCLASVSSPSLAEWVLSNGGKVQGIVVDGFEGSGLGLRASQDAPAGSKLIDLPESCHLTYSSLDDPRLLNLIEQVPSELWGAKLALQLLAHRVQGTSSRFNAYVTNLPIGVPGIPIFFSKQAIDALQYPPVTHQIRKRCKWLYDFSNNALSRLPGTSEDPYLGVAVDINALGWALACVTSRAFRTRGHDLPAACLPLIDMANHSFQPNCEVLPVPGGIAMFTKRKVEAGEPLLLSYGKLSNDFLLMDYGFIIPDNPNDRVQLKFDVELLETGAMVANVMQSDGHALDFHLSPWKRRCLQELQLHGAAANLEVTLGGPQHVDPRLLAASRVLVAKSEAEVQGRSMERLGQLDQPLSKANEIPVLKTLSGLAAVALTPFPTTIEEDEALLAGTNTQPPTPPSAPASSAAAELSDDMKLAIRFRLEKKKILRQTMQALAQQIQEVKASNDLRQNASGTSRKGEKPIAATGKGFGKTS